VAGAVGNGTGLLDGLGWAGELDAVGADSVGFAGLVAALRGEVVTLPGAALGDSLDRPPAPLPRSGTVSSGRIPGRHSTR
jgi:hypothetical protein